MINVLYISYDGMTDNLGQSQVIPYIKGLSPKGYNFTILSCEKSDNFKLNKEKIFQLLEKNNINWNPISYTSTPPVLSTLKDINVLKKEAERIYKKNKFQIVHCRSYISAIVGLYLKNKYGVKFIFDMRGFWADERVDGKIWDRKKWLYNFIYKYFKNQEIKYLTNADYTISLTNAGRQEIHSWKHIADQPIPIEVIPCCADFNHFCPNENQKIRTNELKSQLQISDNDFILSYLGSVGTWYMLDEMFDFFKILKKNKPNAKFLFISGDAPELILREAENKGINPDDIIISRSSRDDVPAYIALSNVSIFFIKPVFSKKASSPTKMGEIMGMGVPIVCNGNVGDVTEIIENSSSGWLVNDFTETEYQKIINSFDMNLNIDKELLRKDAIKYYSLEMGVEKYAAIYEKLLK